MYSQNYLWIKKIIALIRIPYVETFNINNNKYFYVTQNFRNMKKKMCLKILTYKIKYVNCMMKSHIFKI